MAKIVRSIQIHTNAHAQLVDFPRQRQLKSELSAHHSKIYSLSHGKAPAGAAVLAELAQVA